MATFSSVPFVNASERMTEANSLVTQTASDNAFAEQLMQQQLQLQHSRLTVQSIYYQAMSIALQ